MPRSEDRPLFQSQTPVAPAPAPEPAPGPQDSNVESQNSNVVVLAPSFTTQPSDMGVRGQTIDTKPMDINPLVETFVMQPTKMGVAGQTVDTKSQDVVVAKPEVTDSIIQAMTTTRADILRGQGLELPPKTLAETLAEKGVVGEAIGGFISPVENLMLLGGKALRIPVMEQVAYNPTAFGVPMAAASSFFTGALTGKPIERAGVEAQSQFLKEHPVYAGASVAGDLFLGWLTGKATGYIGGKVWKKLPETVTTKLSSVADTVSDKTGLSWLQRQAGKIEDKLGIGRAKAYKISGAEEIEMDVGQGDELIGQRATKLGLTSERVPNKYLRDLQDMERYMQPDDIHFAGAEKVLVRSGVGEDVEIDLFTRQAESMRAAGTYVEAAKLAVATKTKPFVYDSKFATTVQEATGLPFPEGLSAEGIKVLSSRSFTGVQIYGKIDPSVYLNFIKNVPPEVAQEWYPQMGGVGQALLSQMVEKGGVSGVQVISRAFAFESAPSVLGPTLAGIGLSNLQHLIPEAQRPRTEVILPKIITVPQQRPIQTETPIKLFEATAKTTKLQTDLAVSTETLQMYVANPPKLVDEIIPRQMFDTTPEQRLPEIVSPRFLDVFDVSQDVAPIVALSPWVTPRTTQFPSVKQALTTIQALDIPTPNQYKIIPPNFGPLSIGGGGGRAGGFGSKRFGWVFRKWPVRMPKDVFAMSKPMRIGMTYGSRVHPAMRGVQKGPTIRRSRRRGRGRR